MGLILRAVALVTLCSTAALSQAVPKITDPAYSLLRLYAGVWHVTRNDSPPTAKPEEIRNDCARIGNFFACQQTVNGEPGALLVFVPAPNKPGHYYTQNVLQQGRATGRGDLDISGNIWVFSSTWDEGGKTTRYRTTNVFTGQDRIHFEQSESSDGKSWKVTNSGEEVRTASRSH